MMLLVCYYPKMWFYLQLKIVFTLSSFGLVKSTILFLCSFQGTSSCSPFHHITLLLIGFLGQRTYLCTLRSVASSRLVLRRKSFAIFMVGLSGLEPLTSRLSGVRSNQLSYRPIMVETRRIELLTPCLQGRCSPS